LPVTPYHFGPSGFIGLLFKRWIDLPVFVLANVVVDVEVLIIGMFGLGYPMHRYCHTLLIGGLVGALWGLAAYPLRGLWQRIMSAYHLSYEPVLGRMVVSGVLGVWLHVLIDGAQHPDMRILWPNRTFSYTRLAWPYVGNHHLEDVCFALFFCALVVYGFLTARTRRQASKDDSREPLP
jgi:membrane-bound metal-dependent hydrolase YbcI (DUF457 family)